MTGLPKAIIKKYGVSKKAWAVYRGNRGGSMARRKFSVRSTARRVKHYARRSGKAAISSTMTLLSIGFSFGYGYVRGWIISNEYVQKALSYVPFGGQYKDNILLGLGAYLINRFMKPSNSYVKLALRTIVHNEAFIAGAKMQSGATITESSTSSYAGVLLN